MDVMKSMVTIIALGVLAILIGVGLWLYTPDAPLAGLEAKYLNGPGDYLQVAGMRLHVRDSGPRDAPAVILLHGFGASLHTWEAWAQRLSADHRVVRFDLPGFGLTGPDPTGDYSDGRSLTVIAALMDRLGIAHATLIGNSLGGKLAWKFAAENPGRIDRLILISPDGYASPGFEYGKAPEVPAMLKLLPYVLPRPLLRMTLAPAYGDPKRLTEATLTRYRDMMLAPGVRRAIIDRTSPVMLVDPVPILSSIHTPTLLLWGEKDGMIPIGNAADYMRTLPNATLVTLPGLGHVPFEESPDASLAPVRTFLAADTPAQ
jgi:pimeloyl-ACP methyl ester carboxylesterase